MLIFIESEYQGLTNKTLAQHFIYIQSRLLLVFQKLLLRIGERLSTRLKVCIVAVLYQEIFISPKLCGGVDY